MRAATVLPPVDDTSRPFERLDRCGAMLALEFGQPFVDSSEVPNSLHVSSHGGIDCG